MSWSIEIYDERPEIVERRGGPVHVATHGNVPENWSNRDIVERFGIGEHLSVYRSAPGEARRCIQEGRRLPPQ
jgi:hypothetical protein